MGAAVLGSKMLTSKLEMPASTNPSTALKIQSTKPGSQATDMPSVLGSKSIAPVGLTQLQPLVEASFAALAEPEIRAADSAGTIDNQHRELLNTEMTLNKLASEEGSKTIGEEEH